MSSSSSVPKKLSTGENIFWARVRSSEFSLVSSASKRREVAGCIGEERGAEVLDVGGVVEVLEEGFWRGRFTEAMGVLGAWMELELVVVGGRWGGLAFV